MSLICKPQHPELPHSYYAHQKTSLARGLHNVLEQNMLWQNEVAILPGFPAQIYSAVSPAAPSSQTRSSVRINVDRVLSHANIVNSAPLPNIITYHWSLSRLALYLPSTIISATIGVLKIINTCPLLQPKSPFWSSGICLALFPAPWRHLVGVRKPGM